MIRPFPVPTDLAHARRLQLELSRGVLLEGDAVSVTFVAALDASIKLEEDLVAAAVLWDVQEERALEVGFARLASDEVFPYVPGFLSFREAPVYLAALAELSRMPDLLLVDGQGVAHPRGLGIAAHLGVHLDMPAIGVAKKKLYGSPEGVLDDEKGSAVPLRGRGKQVGWVYRSRTAVQPLFVSPGHRIGMTEALEFVERLPGKTKLPEPLRLAHYWAGQGRREGLSGRVTLD